MTQCSNPQHFWYQDLLVLLKIIGDPGNFSLGGPQPSVFFMLYYRAEKIIYFKTAVGLLLAKLGNIFTKKSSAIHFSTNLLDV